MPDAAQSDCGCGGAAGAALAADKPVYDLEQVTSNLLRGGAFWQADTLSFGFYSSLDGGYGGEAAGFVPLSEAQRSAAREALQLWSDVADIRFVESGSASAAISFGNTNSTFNTPCGQYSGYAYGPDGAGIRAGDVWINQNAATNAILTYGTTGFRRFVHEVGHALGLSHPGEYNFGAGICTLTYGEFAEYQQDTYQYSIMSYFNASNTGAYHGYEGTIASYDFVPVPGLLYYPQSPLLHDIAAIQAAYGANYDTRTGDTTYGFNATAERGVLDFTQNPHPVVAIWDGGGTDTLDLSGFSEASVLSLAEGTFSSAAGLTMNIAIAYGVTIENGATGSGNDVLLGNSVANRLAAGDGGDTLAGFDGGDVLSGGAGNDVVYGNIGSDLLSGGPGDDTLYGGQNAPDLGRSGSPSAYRGGTETLLGGDGADVLYGNVGSDHLSGGAGADTLYGGQEDDVLSGGAGDDMLFGNNGADVLYGNVGDDTLIGGEGADTFVLADSGRESSILDYRPEEGDVILVVPAAFPPASADVFLL